MLRSLLEAAHRIDSHELAVKTAPHNLRLRITIRHDRRQCGDARASTRSICDCGISALLAWDFRTAGAAARPQIPLVVPGSCRSTVRANTIGRQLNRSPLPAPDRITSFGSTVTSHSLSVRRLCAQTLDALPASLWRMALHNRQFKSDCLIENAERKRVADARHLFIDRVEGGRHDGDGVGQR